MLEVRFVLILALCAAYSFRRAARSKRTDDHIVSVVSAGIAPCALLVLLIIRG